MSYPWTKNTLEDFLSKQVGGEKVSVEESEPVFVKSMTLAKEFGVISSAYIYRNPQGVLKACLGTFNPAID